MEEILLSLVVAFSVSFFVYWLYLMRGERSARPALIEGEQTKVNSLAVRMLTPYGRSIGRVIARRAAAIEMKGNPHGYGALLLGLRQRVLKLIFAAGNPGGFTPDEFIGVMVSGSLAGLVLGTLVGLADRNWLVILMLVCGTLGCLLPLLWLRREARQRSKAIRKALPYSLDLLTLSVGAGLDFTEAMMRLSKKLDGTPLGRELVMTVRSIQLGKSRAESLRDLSWRVGMVEMSSVTGSIIQADELGASLGAVLGIQADQIRTRRFHAAEEQAMKAPVKIIFPLVACILPTTLFMIFGSMAIPHLDKIMPIVKAQLGF